MLVDTQPLTGPYTQTMHPNAIREKFGDDYIADDRTFVMGIDIRFTAHFAERFKDQKVLETCTGARFTTISLARTAKHVFTVEIDRDHRKQAIHNVRKAGLVNRVSFFPGSIFDQTVLNDIPPVDAIFIDPDWAVTGPDHIYRFIDSNTQPPADVLLDSMFALSGNVAMVLPPFIDVRELEGLRAHEREKLFLGDRHELYCLYFGDLISSIGDTEFRLPK